MFCLLAMTACSQHSPVAPSPIGREVTLAPGQSATVSEAALTLRFEGVSGDSRCPANAFCIQGGDALVQIEVIPASGNRQGYVLHTGDMRPVTHGDLTIALVELSPYPFGTPITPEEYRAKIRLTR